MLYDVLVRGTLYAIFVTTMAVTIKLFWVIAGDLAVWRSNQPPHSTVMHNLIELNKVESREIRLEDANFRPMRDAHGVLIDDPDAAEVERLIKQVQKYPPHGAMYP